MLVTFFLSGSKSKVSFDIEQTRQARRKTNLTENKWDGKGISHSKRVLYKISIFVGMVKCKIHCPCVGIFNAYLYGFCCQVHTQKPYFCFAMSFSVSHRKRGWEIRYIGRPRKKRDSCLSSFSRGTYLCATLLLTSLRSGPADEKEEKQNVSKCQFCLEKRL